MKRLAFPLAKKKKVYFLPLKPRIWHLWTIIFLITATKIIYIGCAHSDFTAFLFFLATPDLMPVSLSGLESIWGLLIMNEDDWQLGIINAQDH